jgi:cell division protein ZapA
MMAQTLEAPPDVTREATAEAPPVARQNVQVPTANLSIAVEIYDQIYNLRGPDPAYIERLAAIVDTKMRAVSAHGNTVDSLRVAVLAALNIADELIRLQEHCRLLRGTMSETQTVLRTRAASLSGLLDSVLDEERRHRETVPPVSSLANQLH